jgi:hypothetical protein
VLLRIFIHARALVEEFRALVQQIGFGGDEPLLIAAHDMGAPPALLWAVMGRN